MVCGGVLYWWFGVPSSVVVGVVVGVISGGFELLGVAV